MTPRALPLAALALAAAGALGGCAGPRPVEGQPTGRAGWVQYALRDLRVEAPGPWRATAEERRLAIEAPDGRARLELSVPGNAWGSERACLAAAEEKLAGQQATLARARLHPTRFGGRSAHALEGDAGGWHVWAVAACDGGVQYRVFFTAATPAAPEALEAWRMLLQSARIGGEA